MADLLKWTEGSGLALVLVVFGMIFFAGRIWPWYTKRQERLDQEQNKRHNQYLASIERENVLVEKFADALRAINMTMQATAQLISDQTDTIDKHHAEVMRELRGE
jgi:hypothetical protein